MPRSALDFSGSRWLVLALLALPLLACRTRLLTESVDAGRHWESLIWTQVSCPPDGFCDEIVLEIYRDGQLRYSQHDSGSVASFDRAQLSADDLATVDGVIQQPALWDFLSELTSCPPSKGASSLDVTLHYGVEPPLDRFSSGCEIASPIDPAIAPLAAQFARIRGKYFP